MLCLIMAYNDNVDGNDGHPKIIGNYAANGVQYSSEFMKL